MPPKIQTFNYINGLFTRVPAKPPVLIPAGLVWVISFTAMDGSVRAFYTKPPDLEERETIGQDLNKARNMGCWRREIGSLSPPIISACNSPSRERTKPRMAAKRAMLLRCNC